MKKVAFVMLLLLGCKQGVDKNKDFDDQVLQDYQSDLTVLDFNGLKPYLNKNDGKTYVVNFWATWCAPCVKELPHFESLNKNLNKNGVEVLLVSLDFPHQYDSKLKPFIKKNNIKSEVLVLDDPDMNSWIPKVDKNWSGSIPATIIYNGKDRKFFERSFTYDELKNEVEQFIN
ncbi:TlpA family protein disulfide reductase [Mangrovimonas aestuarii]|uniref:TlpA family protein disulfide reductase n=1 Tax=Mangrovimonas aestuarii TaxID=3018443 RepID=UPI0023795ECE|nr:TlpA disulfide reductase family protein [Mangrovimonas aestuarii]